MMHRLLLAAGLVLAVHGAALAQATTSTAPNGPNLTTIDGTWSWGGPATGRPNEYNVDLNAVQKGVGVFMEVVTAKLYVKTLAGSFYVWNSATGQFDATTDPNGGGGGTVPGPAQAAGFTTKVISSNFADGSHDNTATWLDCAGASSPEWYKGWPGVGLGNAPCSAISVVTDPTYLNRALRWHWEDSYFVGDGKDGVFMSSGTGTQGKQFVFFYAQVTLRLDHFGGTNPNDVTGFASDTGPWASGVNNTTSNEWDGLQIQSATVSDSCFHINNSANIQCNWFGTDPPNMPGNDFTQYHTFAWRVTSNGTGAAFCSYIDGASQGCQSVPLTSQQLSGSNINTVLMHYLHVNKILGFDMNAYITDYNVWACSGSQTGDPCLSSSANP